MSFDVSAATGATVHFLIKLIITGAAFLIAIAGVALLWETIFGALIALLVAYWMICATWHVGTEPLVDVHGVTKDGTLYKLKVK
jgi:hypothetical protein